MKLFSYGCGRHHLQGSTIEEQMLEYREIARIRKAMEKDGSFEGLEPVEDDERELSLKSRLWIAKMDLVWKAYEAQKESPLAA